MCWASSHIPAMERRAALSVASSSPFSVEEPEPESATANATIAAVGGAHHGVETGGSGGLSGLAIVAVT
ncbi:hypothetical protein GCM10018965_017020 [Nonomuraea roseola]